MSFTGKHFKRKRQESNKSRITSREFANVKVQIVLETEVHDG